MRRIDTTHAAGSPQRDDEDDVLDSWLASLRTGEFAYVLDRLADDDAVTLTSTVG